MLQTKDLNLSKEIKAVLIILSGIFLFLLGYNFLNSTSLFKKENRLFALYENVEGLQVGTKVTVNGLSVGKVAKIDFLPGTNRILVSFTIRNDVVFSKNSVAELYEAGLIGGKSIAIHPVYDNYIKFKSGDTLKSSVKPGLTDVVNQQIAPLQQKLEKVLSNADSLFSAVHEQKDPLLIYKFESFELFKNMISSLNRDIISFLLKGNIPSQNPSIQEAKKSKSIDKLKTSKDDVLNSEELAAKQRAVGSNVSKNQQRVETVVREMPKIGRNEKVKLRNVKNGEDKIVKFKIAVPLINSGEWMLIEKIN